MRPQTRRCRLASSAACLSAQFTNLSVPHTGRQAFVEAFPCPFSLPIASFLVLSKIYLCFRFVPECGPKASPKRRRVYIPQAAGREALGQTSRALMKRTQTHRTRFSFVFFLLLSSRFYFTNVVPARVYARIPPPPPPKQTNKQKLGLWFCWRWNQLKSAL